MVDRIKHITGSRKTRVFLLFLCCSSLAWLFGRLSEDYTKRVTYDLEFTHVPDSLILGSVSKNTVDVRLRANGFQLLGLGFEPKKVSLDLASVLKSGKKYYMPQQMYRNQIERTLSNAYEILDLDKDTLFFRFYGAKTKTVPIRSRVNIRFSQNHMMEGEALLQPNSVKITGPGEEVDTITAISTKKMNLDGISSDFSQTVPLVFPEGLKMSRIASKEVHISGKVVRFSEKIIEVPLTILNLPKGEKIKTFPNSVRVICRAPLETLKEIGPEGFRVVIDFQEAQDAKTNVLEPKLTKFPKEVYSAVPMDTEIEFILQKG